MSAGNLIDVHDIAKTFRSPFLRTPKVAVQGLDLAVQEGEIFGFLGPNGAGKTTTIKILLGLIRPTGGRGALLGQPFGSVKARRQIGYLPDSPNFYRYLTARELLDFTGNLHGMNGADLERRIDTVLDRVSLPEDARNRALRTYSRGMLQRTGIAAAILHRPRLVILDEPMNGLDPFGRADFRDLILGLKTEGATVFLSSHVLADIESTADRVGILDRGELIRCGSLSEILGTADRHVEMRFELREGAELDRIARQLESVSRVSLGWVGYAADSGRASRIAGQILDAGGTLVGLRPRRVSLEDFFLREVADNAEKPVEATPKSKRPRLETPQIVERPAQAAREEIEQ